MISYYASTTDYTTTSTTSSNRISTTDSVIEWSCDNEVTTSDTSIPTLVIYEEPEEVIIEKPKYKREKKIKRPRNRISAIKNPPGGWFFFKG